MAGTNPVMIQAMDLIQSTSNLACGCLEGLISLFPVDIGDVSAGVFPEMNRMEKAA